MPDKSISAEQPFSKEAERAVLGAILNDPEALVLIEGLLVPDHFYLDPHKKIYTAIIRISQAGDVPDLVTVADQLGKEKNPSPFLGTEYIVDLSEAAPVAKNIESYATIVRDKFYLRRLINVCQNAISSASTAAGDYVQAREILEKSLLEMAGQRDVTGLTPVHDVLGSTLDEIQKKIESDGLITGVPTGLDEMDHHLGGLQKSDLIILAARPGMGKTALALNIATNAFFAGKSVAIFTLEMRKEQLMTRVLSSISRVDSARLSKGDLTNDDFDRIVEGAKRIYDHRSNLAIDGTAGITLMELRSRCIRYQKEHGLDLVIIDYLQLMGGERGSNAPREQEVAQISKGLKGLALDLDIPVMALAQLNRGPDQRPDKRPKIADLRESGSMEQDADLILFVYRDEYYNPDSEDVGIAELIVGKNRHGSLKTMKLAFQPNFVSFQNLYAEGSSRS